MSALTEAYQHSEAIEIDGRAYLMLPIYDGMIDEMDALAADEKETRSE